MSFSSERHHQRRANSLFDTDMAPPQDLHVSPVASSFQPPYFQALPPETYTHLIRALLSLQSSVPHDHSPTYQYPTLPIYNYPWPLDTTSVATPNPLIPLLPHALPQTTGYTQFASPPAASTSQDPEGTEDATSTAEDKRRRNTAASARFRVKKKLKSLNLERAVADLTRRTEDLEREANDLRRENAWLKEIVLLKGRNLASPNPGSQVPELASTVRRRENEKDLRGFL